jgi:general secretion pathway protein E
MAENPAFDDATGDAAATPDEAVSGAGEQAIETDAATTTQPLGQIMLERGLISEADRDRALNVQAQIGGRLGAILIRIGAVGEDALLPVLSEQLDMPLLTAEDFPEDIQQVTQWLHALPIAPEWWFDQGVAAWEDVDGIVWAGSRDPLDQGIAETLERALPHHELRWCLIPSQALDRFLDRLNSVFEQGTRSGDDVAQLRELAEEAPVIEFVNNLIAQAADQDASDIHIEPHERNMVARYRIDGVLYTRATLPIDRLNATVSRIKLISGMDIAERRLPQDGRVRTRVVGEHLDIRVSVIPGVRGESVVMRLLPAESRTLDLDSLGMAPDHEATFSDWVHQPHGIILVTGPTGSGKSTSLYAGLSAINDGSKKIITVEDPVEYQIDGVTQIQVQSEIDYTFASALRAILRHDPDVVLVGEIRDLETAEIAVRASLTGHLVLSTLHTNDAPQTLTRLMNMGVPGYNIASSVNLIIAQRLARRLCPECKKAADIPNEELLREGFKEDELDELTIYEPQGCDQCNQGYKGRVGIYQVMPVTDAISRIIMEGGNATDIADQAEKEGITDLRQSGLDKIRQGVTGLAEINRVTMD